MTNVSPNYGRGRSSKNRREKETPKNDKNVLKINLLVKNLAKTYHNRVKKTLSTKVKINNGNYVTMIE